MVSSGTKRFLSSSLLLLLIVGCGREVPVADPSDVRAVLDAQAAGWNEGSIDRYMEGYWRSDSTVFISGGTKFSGFDSVLARYHRSYPTAEAMGHLTFSDIDVRVLSPTSAVVSGVWKLDRSNDTPWGRFTLIFRKKSEGWRIVYDHTSSASAPN